jgi:hypothetical protein
MTVTECQAWVASQGAAIGVNGLPERHPSLAPVLRFELPQAPHQLVWLCRFISRSLQPRHVSLLWVKEFGTFPSTENLHLYYRLRQSYSDRRLLHEAPGHFFLEHEAADLETFLLVGIVNGWEMHLFPELAYGESDMARAIIAHDNEWIALYHRDPAAVDQWREEIEQAHYTVLADGGG